MLEHIKNHHTDITGFKIKPAVHLTEKTENIIQDNYDDNNADTEEMASFKSLCDVYVQWRTSASGGLFIDPGRGENDEVNKALQNRVKKEKGDIYRILQVFL